MPHIDINHFPTDVTDEQRQRLAEDITSVVTRHFNVPDGAVSIALEPVPKHDWDNTVVTPKITARDHLLIKTPNYGTA